MASDVSQEDSHFAQLVETIEKEDRRRARLLVIGTLALVVPFVALLLGLWMVREGRALQSQLTETIEKGAAEVSLLNETMAVATQHASRFQNDVDSSAAALEEARSDFKALELQAWQALRSVGTQVARLQQEVGRARPAIQTVNDLDGRLREINGRMDATAGALAGFEEDLQAIRLSTPANLGQFESRLERVEASRQSPFLVEAPGERVIDVGDARFTVRVGRAGRRVLNDVSVWAAGSQAELLRQDLPFGHAAAFQSAGVQFVVRPLHAIERWGTDYVEMALTLADD